VTSSQTRVRHGSPRACLVVPTSDVGFGESICCSSFTNNLSGFHINWGVASRERGGDYFLAATVSSKVNGKFRNAGARAILKHVDGARGSAAAGDLLRGRGIDNLA